MANNFELNLPATSWTIGTSSYCGFYEAAARLHMTFDDSSDESGQSVHFAMPAGFTGTGTLKADIYYIMASATSGNVVWNISVNAVTDGDSEDLSSVSGYDTANAATVAVPATAGYLDVCTITLTNDDSVLAGDYMRLLLTRDANNGSDTASGDAYVGLVVLREEA